jgi:hypothetical protein
MVALAEALLAFSYIAGYLIIGDAGISNGNACIS